MSQQTHKNCSNAGFTLVEMMIAAGILSVIMLGFTGYIFYQGKMNSNQTSQQNVNYLESTVLKAAGDSDALMRSENLKK